jgi:hypothetical protein
MIIKNRLPKQIIVCNSYCKYIPIDNFIEGLTVVYVLGHNVNGYIKWYEKGIGKLVYDGNSLILIPNKYRNHQLTFSGYNVENNIFTHLHDDDNSQPSNFGTDDYPILDILQVCNSLPYA